MSSSRPSAEKHEKNEKSPTGRKSPDGNRPNMSDLRIVLLGKSLFKNIRVINFILGTNVKETEDLQKHSVRVSGMVENRHISLISFPLLLKLNLSDHQIREGVRDCVSMSAPGPHVFILILHHHYFSMKDKHRVMDVLNCFSDQAMKRTIVLTTDEDIPRSVTNKALNQLIHVCGGGHLQFNEGQSGWCSEMIRRVDDILEKEPEEYLKCDIYEDAEAEGSAEEHLSHKKNKDEGGLLSSISGKSNLNVVLCGADPGLKVNISRLLQRKTSQQKEFSSVCVKREEKIDGHQISVVELPSLSLLSEDEAMHESLHCVSLCDPGVHVFLIIVPVGPLTDKDKAEVEKIQKIFYSSENFMVIFTTDFTVYRHLRDFVELYSECQNLISVCGGRYRVIGLKEQRKSKQIPELLDYIKDMKTEPYSLQMYVRAQEMRVKDEYEEKLNKMMDTTKELQLKINSYGIEERQEDLKHLRMVLIGKRSNGKSATGNTLLGRNEFISQSSSDSVTTVCEKRVCEVDGQLVAVVDTPGLFNTKTQKDQVLEEIMKCVSLSAPGPHAFIIVLSVGRFTQEESETIDLIKKTFGPKVAQFSIVLFTRGDDLKGKSIEDYVKRSNSAELKKLIRDCGDRYLAFNNNETQDRTQVMKLIKMIEEMKTTNHGRYFTYSMFEEAEMGIKKRMEEILKEKEKEMQEQKEELKARHEIEMENIKKRLDEEKRKADEERVQMENKFKEQEETLRKEFEEKEKTEQQKREKEKQKQLEEEKQQRAEYHQVIKEMKKEIEQQRSQREKEREEEDRKREEKYRQDQKKMKHEHNQIIAELKKKREEKIKKRDLDEQKRSEQEERERKEWVRKIKEAENDRKETREEIKRQQREWEEDKKRQMREREEDDKKRRERHEEELREKQEELEKTRKKFERERDEERRQREEERQKQRQEREEKEREYEEKRNKIMKHYEEWEEDTKRQMREREDDERKRRERHEEELREKQEELVKTRNNFERERDEERRQREEERQKQRQEREQKEREYEEKRNEMVKHYEKLERERKEEWERKKQEDDERREEERKRWEKKNEDIKREKDEEMRRIERERKEREWEEREEMKKEHEQRIKEMKKKHEDEARKQAEELNEFRERKEEHIKELKELLEERQKQHEELKILYQQNCEKEEEMRRIERERKEKEEEVREEIKQEHEQRIKEMKKKHEDEARKQVEELNEFRERKEEHIKELKELLEEQQKQHEELKILYQQNCEKEEMRRIERERKEKEEKVQEEIKQEHEQRIKEMKKKHEDDARKQAEELNELRERKEEHIKELKQLLEERQKQHKLLEKLHQHLLKQKSEEIRELQEEVEELKNKSDCFIM